jgi:hypothetical protein
MQTCDVRQTVQPREHVASCQSVHRDLLQLAEVSIILMRHTKQIKDIVDQISQARLAKVAGIHLISVLPIPI